jgi:hypothetical protein
MTLFILSSDRLNQAQAPSGTTVVPDAGQYAGRSIEDLNLIGSETAMPPFSESAIDLNSHFRRALLGEALPCADCSRQHMHRTPFVHGPAITPRVNDALNFSTSYSIFF